MSAFRHDGYSESSVLYLRSALVGIFVPLHSGDNSSRPAQFLKSALAPGSGDVSRRSCLFQHLGPRALDLGALGAVARPGAHARDVGVTIPIPSVDARRAAKHVPGIYHRDALPVPVLDFHLVGTQRAYEAGMIGFEVFAWLSKFRSIEADHVGEILGLAQLGSLSTNAANTHIPATIRGAKFTPSRPASA